VLLFLLIYLFYKYGEELRNKPSSIVQKQWNQMARWKFRYWNELPHLLEIRLNKSVELAVNYLQGFQSDVLGVFASFFAFILGAIAAVLILGGLIDQYFLTNVALFQDKTLVYFLGILLPVLVAIRAIMPKPYHTANPNNTMKLLQKYIQHFPSYWINNAHTSKVKKEFSEFFSVSINIFFVELLSIIFTPIIFFFALPKCADGLVSFFCENTEWNDDIGPTCTFATFNDNCLKEHGNKEYGAPIGTDDIAKQSKHGKLEVSLLNFMGNYPNWTPPTESDGEKLKESMLEQSKSRFGSKYPQFSPSAQAVLEDDFADFADLENMELNVSILDRTIQLHSRKGHTTSQEGREDLIVSNLEV